MKEIKLESGTVLKITPAPFSEALELTKAIADELKTVSVDPQREIDINLIKEMAFTLIASDKVEKKVRGCMGRCLYGEVRIAEVEEVFENENARGDYFKVFQEVLMENTRPFMKSLYAEFFGMVKKLESLPQA